MAGQFTVSYTMDGKEALNVGYILTQAASQSDWQAVADNIAANWAANIMPSLSQQLTMGDVRLKDLDGPIEVIASPPAGTTGSQVGESESIMSAVVITKLDPSSRRKGRWFIPGIPVYNVTAGGTVNATWAFNLANQFQVSQVNLNPVFGSEFANRHVIGPGQVGFVGISSFGFSPTIGKMGRRRF